VLKKALWALPVLAVGIAIGGLTLPNVFASSTTRTNTLPAQPQQMMQQMLNTPQGQAMFEACNKFMSQFGQVRK
jgi:hypothetical protein